MVVGEVIFEPALYTDITSPTENIVLVSSLSIRQIRDLNCEVKQGIER
jgi:hypothetical protein